MVDKVAEDLEKLLDDCAKGLIPNQNQSNLTHNKQEEPVVAESSQPLVPGSLSSNLTLDEMIAQWRDLQRLQPLLSKLLYASVSDDIATVKKIRSLTAESSVVPQFLEVKSVKNRAINRLLNLSTVQRALNDSSLQEDLVSIVFMIFYHKLNRGKIQAIEYPVVVFFLVESLTAKTSDHTRRHAAASLYLWSTIETNKKIIGQLGGIGPLIKRMEAETDQMALRFANAALCNLCTVVENREIAVSSGAVMAAMGKIMSLNRILDDELNLRFLALLSSHEWKIGETEANDMLHCLFGTLGVEGTTMSKECEEHCVVIAHRLCLYTRRIENVRQTLEHIASNGRTTKSREKASELIVKLCCFWME